MFAIRKPNHEKERKERASPAADRKPAPAKFTRYVDHDRKDLDDPTSLFWRGLWMTVF